MSLYANINRRKKAGTSRSKKDSTISPEAYDDMKRGFPKGEKGMKLNKKKRELTDSQKKKLENHKEHHSDEHMKMMIELMQSGKTFDEAHSIAMKKVGK
mgnify:FL=1|tara:strand:+ start:1507 stop:1803 length:297 start_codon:yes stop_codon:yes gene_type:complete